MYREGMWRKGLFPNDSKGDSKKLDYLTYDAKLSLGYKFSGAHSIEANVAYMQQAPKFATAFVSPRTRNTTTPGLKAEKVFGADLTYNLNLPYIKARVPLDTTRRSRTSRRSSRSTTIPAVRSPTSP